MLGVNVVKSWVLGGMAVTIIALSADPITAQTITVGNTAVVVRTVTGTLDASDRTLAFADDVYHNELIQTEAGAATEIVFLDSTKLALGPDSSLTLDRVVYDPDPDKSVFVMTAAKGVFRFLTGNLPGKPYTIHTPSATIGIRGTEFTLSILPSVAADGSETTVVTLTLEKGGADIVGCSGQSIALDWTGRTVTLTKAANGTCSQEISG